jgi:proton glutamate symport protein
VGLTARVLLGLAAGVVAGVAIAVVDHPYLHALVPLVEPVGRLWVNAIRMTVIPLVVSLLIVGVASASDMRAMRRIGGRGLGLFLLLLSAAGALAVLIAAPLFRWLPIAPEATEALRARAGLEAAPEAVAAAIPSAGDWLVGLVPTNPVAAAAQGALLPLIVFTIAFGLAAIQLAPEPRQLLVGFFQAVGDAMLVLVRWILDLAPLGVFALALPLAGDLGLEAAGALVYYVLLAPAICVLILAALYPLGALLGGVPIRDLARAMAPAQGVAFSSRSSLAALPALIEGAKAVLRLPPAVTGLFLPFSVSVFRISAPIGIVSGTLFLARLYGVELGPQALATITVMAVFLSFSVPGIPGGSIIIMVPVLLAAGVPIEGIGLLLAIDTVPDMFRTTTNVTAHMALAAILGGGRAGEGPPSPGPRATHRRAEIPVGARDVPPGDRPPPSAAPDPAPTPAHPHPEARP